MQLFLNNVAFIQFNQGCGSALIVCGSGSTYLFVIYVFHHREPENSAFWQNRVGSEELELNSSGHRHENDKPRYDSASGGGSANRRRQHSGSDHHRNRNIFIYRLFHWFLYAGITTGFFIFNIRNTFFQQFILCMTRLIYKAAQCLNVELELGLAAIQKCLTLLHDTKSRH